VRPIGGNSDTGQNGKQGKGKPKLGSLHGGTGGIAGAASVF
jgi:hypothetical protein